MQNYSGLHHLRCTVIFGKSREDYLNQKNFFLYKIAYFNLLCGVKMRILWDKKMAVFWVVALCRLVEVYRRFRGACCLYHQDALMMNL
jgi:hypothetical protein